MILCFAITIIVSSQGEIINGEFTIDANWNEKLSDSSSKLFVEWKDTVRKGILQVIKKHCLNSTIDINRNIKKINISFR